MPKQSLSTLLISLILLTLLSGCQQSSPDVKDASWWNDATFYEILVRSYADSNGDGKGDFKGLTAKLDYLNDGKPETHTDLGVTAIWLMPIQPSPSYHGYDITDYMTVNPDYGTLDDFKQFLSEAHKRGIHVVMDFVINHTSVQHPWFLAASQGDPKYRDFYIWSDSNPGYKGPWGEQVWFPQGSSFYYAVFDPAMPDLNQGNPAVVEEIHKITRFWVEEVGIDGLRVDGAKHLIENGQTQANTAETHAWFKAFNPYFKGLTLKDWQPAQQGLIVGEAWDASDIIAPYVTNSELDLVFNFDLASKIIGGVKLRDGSSVASAIAAQTKLFNGGHYGTFLTNHDMERVMSTLNGELPKARAAAAILLTAPGVPFVYYGEEIGILGGKPDTNIRTPMQWSKEANAGFTSGTPWNSPVPDYDLKNVAAQSADPQSLLSLYRDLIQIRSQHYAMRTGAYIEVTSNNSSLYTALRVAEKEAFLIIVNIDRGAVAKPKINWLESPLKGSYKLEALLGPEGTQYAPLKVGAKGEALQYQPVDSIPAGGIMVLRLKP